MGGGVLELVFDPNTQRLHSWQQLAWEAPRDEYADLGGFEEAASDEPDGTELLFAMLALLNQGGAMDPGWAGIGGGGFSEAGFMGGGAQAAAAGGSVPFGFDGTYVPDDPSNPESAGYDPFIADSEGWPGGAYENPSSGYYDPGSFDTGGDF